MVSVVALEHPTTVQGVFVSNSSVDKSKRIGWLLLQVKLKVGHTIIAQTSVQENGSYIIDNQTNANADLIYSGIGINGDVYLATILPHQPDTIKLTSKLPRSPTRKHRIATCPKCQRKDKVLPIDGQAGVMVKTINVRGDTMFLPYGKKHYYPDSDVSSWLDPHWYCVRDTIKF